MSYYGSGGGGGGGYYGQQQQNYGGSQQYGDQQSQSGYASGYSGDSSGWQQQQQQYPQQPQNYQSQNQYNIQQQPQQYQPQQQPQQMQSTTTPSLWNPAVAAMAGPAVASMAGMVASSVATGGNLNEAYWKIASEQGKTFFQSNTARMIPGLESTMLLLRDYFAVDNKYVVQKMKRVLFPFLSDKQGWQRKVQLQDPGYPGTPPTSRYEVPRFDECAPDLYLPVMSLITYVLLSALCYGTAGEFNPEVLPDVTSKCAIYQTLEVIIIWCGMYAMQVPSSFLDLYSYTGYKYLGLCINMLVGIIVGHFGLFGSRGYYACFLWTATAAAYFMLKTMSNNIPTNTSPNGPKREFMILGFAALQYFTLWMVSQTKFL